MIFLKAGKRTADGPDEASFKIGLAAHEVEYLAGKWVFKKAIDGEVSTAGIDLRLSNEVYLVGAAPVAVLSFASKGSNFDVFTRIARHEDDSEVRANGLRFREEA